ncbi:hypothetical protein PFISCL1PPCAC_4153, partial [Pristionchus fissidentatus]
VYIDLYPSAAADSYPNYDAAHIRIDRDWYKPVTTNTLIFGEETVKDQPLDVEAPSTGWWRVDVHKVGEIISPVLSQDFWSDVRTFKISLDDIKTITILSDFVDYNYVHFFMKLPNDNLPPVTYDHFKDVIHTAGAMIIQEFPNFPVGAHIEMSVWLQAHG